MSEGNMPKRKQAKGLGGGIIFTDDNLVFTSVPPRERWVWLKSAESELAKSRCPNCGRWYEIGTSCGCALAG